MIDEFTAWKFLFCAMALHPRVGRGSPLGNVGSDQLRTWTSRTEWRYLGIETPWKTGQQQSRTKDGFVEMNLSVFGFRCIDNGSVVKPFGFWTENIV